MFKCCDLVLQGFLLDILRQHEGLLVQPVIIEENLRPDLRYRVSRKLPGPLLCLPGALDRPEASVAGDVLQIVVRVAGSDEDAAALVMLHLSSIAGAIDVLLSGDEALDALDLRLPHSLQLRDLIEPCALDLLGRGLVSHILEGQRVGEPCPAQLRDQRALADASGTGEHRDIIELAAGTEDPGDRCEQPPLRHLAGVGTVLGPQVVDQDRLHPWYAIPVRQALHVVLDRVEGSLVCDLGEHVRHVCPAEVVVVP